MIESKVVIASNEMNDAVEQLRALRKQQKILEVKEKELKDQICKYMGENEELIDKDGLVAITWATIKDSQRLDSDTIKLMYPEIYNDCLTIVSGVRRFVVK